MSAEHSETQTLLATLTGADRPGVTSHLFASLEDLDIAVLDVARRHATIRWIDGGYVISDNHSSNGTWAALERLMNELM